MTRLIRLALALAWLLAPIPVGAQVLSLTDGTAATSLPTLPFSAGTLAAPSLVFTGDVERGLYLQTGSVGIAGGAHITGPVTVTALATPGSITVTPQGTPGVTTYTYKLVATVGGQTTEAGADSSTATGNATLDGTNFNRNTWAAVPGATGYRIYRTVGGATQGLIATIALGATVTVDDTGLAGGGETAPTSNASGQMLAPAGTAGRPTYSWGSDPTSGFYSFGGGQMGWSATGAYAGTISGSYINVAGTTSYFSMNDDVILRRDGAANTLALRNGTAAQTFNFAATYTDASNYIRGQLSATSTAVSLIAQGAGTGAGANVDIVLTPIGTGTLKIGTAAGLSATTTVRDAAGTGTCTLIFTAGIKTGGTC